MFKETPLPLYIVKNCPFCGKPHEVMVYEDDFDAWQNGDLLAQEAFPYLTASEREILISGICPQCWDKMFPEEEEEEEEEDPALYEFEPGRYYWNEMAANP